MLFSGRSLQSLVCVVLSSVLASACAQGAVVSGAGEDVPPAEVMISRPSGGGVRSTVLPSESAAGSGATVGGVQSSVPVGVSNGRGNFELVVGESASLVGADGGVLYSMTVRDVEFDFVCTAPGAVGSENGMMVRLEVEVRSAGVGAAGGSAGYFVYADADEWRYILADGSTFSGRVNSRAAHECVSDAESILSVVPPGEVTRGAVVLDVPSAGGVFVFRDRRSAEGWEWRLAG